MRAQRIGRIAPLLLGAIVAAGADGRARQARPGLPTTPAPEQEPAGRIRGCVVAADTLTPLRQAGVQAIATSIGVVRSTATDASGCYVLTNLPTADYLVRVSKETYATVGFGEDPETGREEQTCPVSGGRTVEGIHFRVPKAGVISGRVLDEAGEPVPYVRVQALSVVAVSGVEGTAFPYEPAARITDDLGGYRLFGLPAGDYVVLASPATQAGRPPAELSGFTPTFFPGSPEPSAATVLSVKPGQVLQRVDVVLVVAPRRGR